MIARRRAVAALVLAWCGAVAGAQTIRATTVPTTAATMDDATLLSLCKSELRPQDREAIDAKLLLAAHRAVEDFFSNPPDRKETIASLEAMTIGPNVVGRIARIRSGWPEFAGGGTFYINEKLGPHVVKYFVGLPATYTRTKAWPLVIKLAEADNFVTNPRPNGDLVASWHHQWIDEELQKHPDAIVLMPLLNLDELYGPSYAGMNTVIQPLYHAADRFNIDESRVYLVGHSMAAHAVWNLALHYPTYFAAFDAMAGSASQEFQRVRMMNLRNTLPVVWHDSADKVVKVDLSRALARILKTQKIEFDYTETKGIGHAPTDEIVEQTYAKMRARTRELYPRRETIQSDRPDSIFNRADWVQMYQPLNPGDEKWIMFSQGRGHMVTFDHPMKTDATINASNHIEATTDNVESIRFYLNDQMVDFSKVVTVVVNHKSVFEDLVKPSVATVLNDQLFLGRGVRYFSATIDIDLGPKPTSRASSAPLESRTR